MGFTGRKYNLNESYFEEINTPEKAYILGFFMTDGYNSNSRIRFAIQKKDYEVLDFIRNEICPELEIREYNGYIYLDMCSKKICSDISKLGGIKSKSLTLKFPDIREDLLSHFIRGCFDGDGSVMYRTYKYGRKKKGIMVNYVCASLDFIDKFKNIIKEKCELIDRKTHIHNKTGCFYLQYSGSNVIEKIFNFIYKDDCFSLSRKKNKFIEYYGNVFG